MQKKSVNGVLMSKSEQACQYLIKDTEELLEHFDSLNSNLPSATRQCRGAQAYWPGHGPDRLGNLF
jgi:hypothetical protein